MPLTRVDGDFTQISNVVVITIPEEPDLEQQLFVGFMDGETFLVANDLSSADESGTVDYSLGFGNGYEKNADSTILGSYGAYGEGTSAGASRSSDFSFSWQSEGFPIYSQAPPRHSRVAFGAGVFFHAGTRNTGETRAASSTDFGNDSFTWDANFTLQDGIGVGGCAGVDFVAGFFYAYGNSGTIGRSADTLEWEQVADGMPFANFQSSSSLPYARFAGNDETVVGIFASQIVVSEDGGLSFTTNYVDAFNDQNEVGGAGFNEPYMCGLAFGGGVWVAVGNVGTTFGGEGPGQVGTPRIRRSSVGAETPWEDIPLPETDQSLTQVLDVIYDAGLNRFLVLARGPIETTPLSGGDVLADTDDVDGASGSVPTGFITYDSLNSQITASEVFASGQVLSGDLAGYSDFGVIRTGELGGQTTVILRVPIEEWRSDWQVAYFSTLEIPGSLEPAVSVNDAVTNSEFDEDFIFVEMTWTWFAGDSLTGEVAQRNFIFGPAELPPEIVGSVFHILQSVDGGATFTLEITQEYLGTTAKDKGWLHMLTTPPSSFNLLQEDGFAVLQEDGFHILVSDDPPAAGPPALIEVASIDVNLQLTWAAAAPVPGDEANSYEIYRIDSTEYESAPTFSDPGSITTADPAWELITTVDAPTVIYFDSDTNNQVRQYGYYVKAIITPSGNNLNSNIMFSSAPS